MNIHFQISEAQQLTSHLCASNKYNPPSSNASSIPKKFIGPKAILAQFGYKSIYN